MFATPASIDEHHEVEQFLYREASLLDEWELDAWLEMFTDDAHYFIPATDLRDGQPENTLYLISDDMTRLRSRVSQINRGITWAENPRSRTRRIISNIQVSAESEGIIAVTANFVVNRLRFENVDAYIGRYDHKLVRQNGELKMLERRARLDLEALRPHGKVSFIV
jgi:p-cumate 2,3-dioxygenase beta subunit